MRITRRKFTFTLTSLAMLASTGCAGISGKSDPKQSLLDRMPWVDNEEKEPEPYPNPAKIAVTWTPDTLVQMGRTPTRGFGGRVYFYDERSRAVPVEGTLIVHGFHDKAESPKEAVKRFEFTPEQLTRHFGRTDLGASYSIWIPWDAMGGMQKRITLVASFKTAAGRMVQGTPATVLLPGQKREVAAEDDVSWLSPDYQKYKEALANNTAPQSGLTTTTIRRRQQRISTPRTPKVGVPRKDLMIASGNKTPSLDVTTLRRRPQSATIQPVSAQEPVNRK